MRKAKANAAKPAKARVLRSIFASIEAALPETGVKNLALSCQSCSHSFGLSTVAELSKLQPFCVKCGSEKVNIVTKAEEYEVEDLTEVLDEDLASLECPSCEANLIMHAQTAAEHNGRITCPVCASETMYTEQAEDGGSPDDMEDVFSNEEAPDDQEDVFSNEEAPDDQEDVFSGEDDSDEEDDGDAEDLDVEAEDGGDSEDLPDEEDDALAEGEDDDQPADDAGDANDVEDDAEAEEDDDLGGDRPDDVDDMGDEVTMNLAELTLASAGEKSVVRFTRIGARIVCFVNDVSIATLHQDRMPEQSRAAFEQKTFLQAIQNHANSKGVMAALEEFSFEQAKITSSKKKLAALREAEASAMAEAVVESKLHNFSEELRACLSIASVGINKNFWSKISNPIKAALVAELKAAGMRNPEKTIDAAFASAGDEYNRVLIEQAFSVFDKPVDIRNALATELDAVNYRNMSKAGDEDEIYDEEDEDVDEFEASLASPMRPTKTDKKPATASNKSETNVVALVQKAKASHGSLF